MKISDLLDLVERQVATELEQRPFHGNLRDSSRGKRSAFASGRPDRSDPHMFQKYNHRPLGGRDEYGADGYEAFIRYLLENDIDNPHFPVVYGIKKITDKNGKYINKYNVERLQEFDTLERDDINLIIRNNFEDMAQGEFEGMPRIDMLDTVAALIEDTVSRFPLHINYFRQDSLKEALEILHNIANAKRFHVDIHRGNLMVRRGPVGLQLVINDPFSFSRDRR